MKFIRIVDDRGAKIVATAPTDGQVLTNTGLRKKGTTSRRPLSGKSGALTETVTRSQTVPENMTLNQREVVLFNLLDAAMKDLNARLEASIPQYMGPLIR